MFLIFPFAVLASFFGRIRGGNMIIRLCMTWADLWFPLVFIFPRRIYLSPHDSFKPYIFVSNHSSYLDAALLVKAYRQPFRPLGKAGMSRIPIFGFIYRNAIVTVDRANASDRARSVRVLKSVLGRGISIMFFPEGTFSTEGVGLKSFYDGAFRIAIETQTPIKPVLFPDAANRMPPHELFSLSPGRCRLVYLEEIPVTGLGLKDAEDLKNRVHAIMKKELEKLQNNRSPD